VKYLGIALVYVWRYTVGAFLPRGQCKYHPSCSQYAIDALAEARPRDRFGEGGWRLLRCNPWSRGGVDYA
jgi:putative membrane protein insertion efficiency factor